MPETLFAYDENNYHSCQTSFRGGGNQEYYLGDYSIEGGSVVEVRADRKAVGPCSIIRLRSRSRLSFRRSWSHIRQDATNVTILWFVKRGALSISTQCGRSVAAAGDFALTRSMNPFFIECQTDAESVHEVLHVTVPTHILRSFVPDDVRTGFSMPAEASEFQIVEHILADILKDGDELSPDSARVLLDSALTVVGHALRADEARGPARQTVSDRRLQEVLRFIEVHLSDPNLSTTFVAKGCGISPRYLSFLLRLHGTSFSTLVWEQRLKRAKMWLTSSKPTDVSISEIAYSVGFKSPAHFSRMFKRVFSVNPREYRETSAAQAGYAEASASLQ